MAKRLTYTPRPSAAAFILSGLIGAAGLAAAPGAALGQAKTANAMLDTVVVTGTRDDRSLAESTKSLSVVTKENLEERQNYFLPKLAAQSPGLAYTNNGGMGQWSTLSIRGTGAKYTSFQFNGLTLQDVADTQGAFTGFLEDLHGTGNIRQIEVLRGAGGALHGSRAIGGVVNITTDRWFDGLKAELRNEFGPNATYVGNARLAYGRSDEFYFDFDPIYARTDGETYSGQYGLGYENKGASITAGFKPLAAASLELAALMYKSRMDSSDSPQWLSPTEIRPQMVTNPQNRRESLMNQFGLIWSHGPTDDWDYSLKASHGQTERHYLKTASGFQALDKGHYDGETLALALQHNFRPTDWLTINGGVDFQKMTYKELSTPFSYSGDFTENAKDWSYDSWEPFLQFQGRFLADSLLVNLGGRYSKYSAFAGKFLGDVSAAYVFSSTGTKIHAQAAEGYRAPSLYELYGGYMNTYASPPTWITIGDANLKPEESLGFEVGVEQKLWEDKVNIGLTYFKTDVKKIIYYDAGYRQGNKGESSGLEAWLSFRPVEELKFTLAHTYVDSRYKDRPNSAVWERTRNLPRNVTNLNLTAWPVDGLTLSLNLARRDETPVNVSDASWTTHQWREKASAVVDLAASYAVHDNVDLFVRVDNLFDEKYTVGAYSQPGVSFFGGARFHY